MQPNNPALRLHTLLEQLKRSNPNSATKDVLANAFGVSTAPKELFHAIVRFHELTDQVVAFAEEKTQLPSAPLKRHIPQIESAVQYTNLDSPWANYVGRITDQCMLVIEMIAHTEGIPQDVEPSSQDFSELQSQLDNLFEAVISNKELDKEFRAYVLQQIEQIRRCLSEYRISGAQGFVKYLQVLMVQTRLHADAIKRQEEKNSDVTSRFKAMLGSVKKFVTFTESGIELIKKVQKIQAEGVPLLEDLSSLVTGETPEVNTDQIA